MYHELQWRGSSVLLFNGRTRLTRPTRMGHDAAAVVGSAHDSRRDFFAQVDREWGERGEREAFESSRSLTVSGAGSPGLSFAGASTGSSGGSSALVTTSSGGGAGGGLGLALATPTSAGRSTRSPIM